MFSLSPQWVSDPQYLRSCRVRIASVSRPAVPARRRCKHVCNFAVDDLPTTMQRLISGTVLFQGMITASSAIWRTLQKRVAAEGLLSEACRTFNVSNKEELQVWELAMSHCSGCPACVACTQLRKHMLTVLLAGQDTLAALILSECAYKKVEMSDEQVAQKITEFMSEFPSELLHIEMVQASLNEVPQK